MNMATMAESWNMHLEIIVWPSEHAFPFPFRSGQRGRITAYSCFQTLKSSATWVKRRSVIRRAKVAGELLPPDVVLTCASKELGDGSMYQVTVVTLAISESATNLRDHLNMCIMARDIRFFLPWRHNALHLPPLGSCRLTMQPVSAGVEISLYFDGWSQVIGAASNGGLDNWRLKNHPIRIV
jgi:hypothetical protein